MVPAALEEGADELKDPGRRPVVLSFEHAAYADMGEETVEVMDEIARPEVDVEVGGEELF